MDEPIGFKGTLGGLSVEHSLPRGRCRIFAGTKPEFLIMPIHLVEIIFPSINIDQANIACANLRLMAQSKNLACIAQRIVMMMGDETPLDVFLEDFYELKADAAAVLGVADVEYDYDKLKGSK